MKVLVTGATGLLGSHLACHLKLKGYAVVCGENRTDRALFQSVCWLYQLNASDFDWVQCDILDIDSVISAVSNCNAVFHCAAMVSYRARDKNQLLETNRDGTANIVNACLRAKVSTLIYASSIAAIGRKNRNNIINESSEWVDGKFNSGYGISKHLAEMEVFRAAEEGLNVGIVNPGVIIGAGNGHRSSNAMFHQIEKEYPFFPIGKNGFVGVKDVCRAMISVLENKVFGKRIILVSENLYFKDIMEKAAKLMAKKTPHIALNGFLLRLAVFISRACEFFYIPFPLPSHGLVSTSLNSQYESENIHLLTDFTFDPIDQSIEETISQLKYTAKAFQ